MTYLREEDGNGDDELVDGAHGPPEGDGGDLREVHRGQAGVDAGVDADHEAAHHLGEKESILIFFRFCGKLFRSGVLFFASVYALKIMHLKAIK